MFILFKRDSYEFDSFKKLNAGPNCDYLTFFDNVISLIIFIKKLLDLNPFGRKVGLGGGGGVWVGLYEGLLMSLTFLYFNLLSNVFALRHSGCLRKQKVGDMRYLLN